MSNITEAGQNPTGSMGALVTLFQLDLTSFGDIVYNFTMDGKPTGANLVFGGISFTPIDIEANGFEWGGSGTPPTPTIKISNASMAISALLTKYDLVGATLTRIRTFRNFLDDGATPDPTAKFPIDVFRVERKTAHNKVFAEFELAVIFDQEGVMLPARQCLRDACTHIYRRWNETTGAFDYTKTTCPYTGTNYFDRTGAKVGARRDVCGKRLSDCAARFGDGAVLPTRSFPGMQRFTT